MKQYEYKSVPFSDTNLSVEGMQGWNLCTVTQDGTAIFSREIESVNDDYLYDPYDYFYNIHGVGHVAPVDQDFVN